MENSNVESGNINPKTWWDKFKSAPRPLLKYSCVPLLFILTISENTPEWKFRVFLGFVAILFVSRGAEKLGDMWTARK